MKTKVFDRVKRLFAWTMILQMFLAMLPVPNVYAAVSVGPRSGTIFPSTGYAWTAPQNAASSDNIYASNGVTSGTTAHHRSLGYGFNIPESSAINGIVVNFERKASASNCFFDGGAMLMKDGVTPIPSSNQVTPWAYWPTADGVKIYGSPTNLWGQTWTPAEINSSNFGFDVYANKGTCSGMKYAYIDHVSITVYYTLADSEAPVITVTGSSPINIALGSTYVEPGATWTDNVDISGSAVVGGDAVDTGKAGTYTVRYNYTDAAGNVAIEKTRVVNVIDPATLQPPYFVASPQFVRQNNATDMKYGSRILANILTQNVKFYVDGSTVPTVGSLVNPSDTTKYYLAQGLSAGQHIVTAEYTLDGANYIPVSGGVVINSLDTPWFSYILPSSDGQVYRPDDNPLRIRIDDEFGQVKSVIFELYSYDVVAGAWGSKIRDLEVLRANCDLREAGSSITCDARNSVAWQTLPAGYYRAKVKSTDYAGGGLRTIHAGTASNYFLVDSQRPEIADLQIRNVEAGYLVLSKGVVASVTASDDTGINNVRFYITSPRSSDGKCDGNGDVLVDSVASDLDADNRYRSTIDTSSLDGRYCLNAIAEDKAKSHSVILREAIVLDNTAPVITLLGDAIVYHELGAPYADAGAAAFDSYDGDLTSILSTINSVIANKIGDYTVTYNVSDSAGNKADEVARNVYVRDTVAPAAPSIILPANESYHRSTPIKNQWTEVFDASGIKEYRIEYQYDDGHLFSGAPYRTVTATSRNHTPSLSEQGGVRYRVQAIDKAGNYGAWSEWVHYYYDATAPIITHHADVLAEAGSSAGAAVVFDSPTATDNVDEAVIVNCDASSGSIFAIGETSVTCTAADTAGNVAVPVSFKIVVQDTTAPVIALNGVSEMTLEVGETYDELGASWTDAVDGAGAALISGIVDMSTVGDYEVKYDYMDAAGNSGATISRIVHIVDTTVPVITLIGAADVALTVGDVYTDAGVVAIDNYDGDITDNVIVTSNVATEVLGEYTVKYNVSDANGNVAVEVTRKVTVGPAPVVPTVNVPTSAPLAVQEIDEEPEVLGTEDDKDVAGVEDQDDSTTSVEGAQQCALWLGICWYWLAFLAALTLGAGAWYIVGRRRNSRLR